MLSVAPCETFFAARRGSRDASRRSLTESTKNMEKTCDRVRAPSLSFRPPRPPDTAVTSMQTAAPGWLAYDLAARAGVRYAIASNTMQTNAIHIGIEKSVW